MSLWETCAGAVLPRRSLAPFSLAKRNRNTRSFCSQVRSEISTLPDMFNLQIRERLSDENNNKSYFLYCEYSDH